MINYEDFLKLKEMSFEQLLGWSHQTLVKNAPGVIPSLPAPPMLMFHRITKIEHNGKRGRIVAEQDIHLDDWFFQCHFRNDPVQPGCLGVDAIWQLLGMYCALRGATGSGRALGCKDVEFSGQIRPFNKIVTYDIEVRRFTNIQGSSLIVGNGTVSVDGEQIYTVNDAKVGVFGGILYPDYPKKSENAVGGVLKK